MAQRVSVRDLRLVVQDNERDHVRDRTRLVTLEDERERLASLEVHLEDFSFDATAASAYVPWKGDRTEGAVLNTRRLLIVPFLCTIARVRLICETDPVGMTLTWRDDAGTQLVGDSSIALAATATPANTLLEFEFDLDVDPDDNPLVSLFVSGMTNAPNEVKGIVDFQPLVDPGNPAART